MLEVRGLTVRAGGFTVKDINLNVEDSTCHVIIGRTGSGKTVLLETIIGLRKPLKGEIYLNGKEITSLPVEKRGLSYLPQDLALFPHLSVRDNIFYGPRVRKEKDKRLFDLIHELVENLGISHLLDRPVHNLSGGEQQRVALIRAMATGSRYLLLDEPLSSLHEGMKKELWFLIKKIQRRYGLTILMVTHDMEEAFLLGDTISVMIDGLIHQTGSKDEVYRHPQSIEVARFFGIRNLFGAEVIESMDNKMIVRCDELNCNLTIPVQSFTDLPIPRFIIGIRAEDVMILRPELKRQDQDNLLEGTITEIFKKGMSHTVLFLPEGARRDIEIEVPDYAFQKLSLVKGQKAGISLRGERIFLSTE